MYDENTRGSKCMSTLRFNEEISLFAYTITPRCFRNSIDPGDRKFRSNVPSLYDASMRKMD